MKDFIRIDVQPLVDRDSIFEHVSCTWSEFNWRKDESEVHGVYVAGVNDEDVQVKLWLRGRRVAISISFRGAWLNLPDREGRKLDVVRGMTRYLIPALGDIVKLDT